MFTEAYKNDSGNKSQWAVVVDKLYKMAALKDKETLEVPRNIHLKEKQDSLVIEYSWFKLKYLIFLFVVPVCSYVIVESKQVEGSFEDISFPVAVILIANIILIYYCITRLINTTTISVNREHIKINHQPLPLVKSAEIKRKDLSQLYVAKHTHAKRYNFNAATFQLNAILNDNHVIMLVGGLADPKQGRFIEQKIEKFLGITDIAVEGEIEKQ